MLHSSRICLLGEPNLQRFLSKKLGNNTQKMNFYGLIVLSFCENKKSNGTFWTSLFVVFGKVNT